MHRRAAGNVEQVALGMVDDGAEGHRRIGRAEGGKPHGGDFLAECFGGNCQAVHVRHLALIGGHAGGGVTLDMLDGVHALAHGEAHILGTDIVLEIDEGHDMVIGTRTLCRADQMAAHGGKARGLRGFDCPPADGCGCCSDGFCQRGVHVVGAVARADGSAILDMDIGYEAAVLFVELQLATRLREEMDGRRPAAGDQQAVDLELLAQGIGNRLHGH